MRAEGKILIGEGLTSGQGGSEDEAKAARLGLKFQSRGSVPVKVWRLIAEERDPRADAAGGVVEDAVLAASHALRRAVPEALGALVNEARGKLGAQGADPVLWHEDAVAAVVAELTLEVQLARQEVGRASGAAVELELRAPALVGVHHERTALERTGWKCRLHCPEREREMLLMIVGSLAVTTTQHSRNNIFASSRHNW